MNIITNNANIKSFIVYIFILLPITFVVGPALVEVFNFILILFLLKHLVDRKKF